MNIVYDILSEYAELNEAAQRELAQLVERIEVKKGTLLLKQDAFCNNIYFIESGLARGFYYREGREVTSWFAVEREVITSMYAFIKQVPSIENIEIIEDSVLHALSYQDLQQLYQQYPAFNKAGRVLTEKYYIILEERIVSFQYQSAKKRYQDLVAQQSDLLRRVPLKHIASYLGISQETLSRIRTKGG